MELPPENLSSRTLEDISRLEPYGEGNPPPVFLSPEEKLQLLDLRFGRARVKVGSAEMVCWEREVIRHLKGVKRGRVVYSVEGRQCRLLLSSTLCQRNSICPFPQAT